MLIEPYAILKSWRAATQAVRTFAVQLAILGLSLAFLVLQDFWSRYGKTSAWANKVIGIFSGLGITAAAVTDESQEHGPSRHHPFATGRLHNLVAGDITTLPDLPGKSKDAMQKLTVQACQERTLTTTQLAA